MFRAPISSGVVHSTVRSAEVLWGWGREEEATHVVGRWSLAGVRSNAHGIWGSLTPGPRTI